MVAIHRSGADGPVFRLVETHVHQFPHDHRRPDHWTGAARGWRTTRSSFVLMVDFVKSGALSANMVPATLALMIEMVHSRSIHTYPM
jgi:hypothetical protein